MSTKTLVGVPGSGKSYQAVKLVLPKIRRGEIVLSNFPIRDYKTGRTSFMWKNDYLEHGLIGVTVVLDEAWKNFDARKWKTFTDSEHDFFSCSRQNFNEIYIIAQNATHIEKIIRDVSQGFYFCKCWHIPVYSFKDKKIKKFPVIFKNKYKADFEAFKHEFISWNIFSFKIGSCYDNHFFKCVPPSDIVYEAWDCSNMPVWVPWWLRVLRFIKRGIKGFFDGVKRRFSKTEKSTD